MGLEMVTSGVMESLRVLDLGRAGGVNDKSDAVWDCDGEPELFEVVLRSSVETASALPMLLALQLSWLFDASWLSYSSCFFSCLAFARRFWNQF